MKRILFIMLGFLSIALGIIGIFVPLLPTTAFLLLAAWLFSKSSPRWRSWLINHPFLGAHIHNYLIHKGITRKAKIRSIAALWITLSVSAYFAWHIWFTPIILLVVGIGVTWHVLTLQTVTDGSMKDSPSIKEEPNSNVA